MENIIRESFTLQNLINFIFDNETLTKFNKFSKGVHETTIYNNFLNDFSKQIKPILMGNNMTNNFFKDINKQIKPLGGVINTNNF
jgi:hypothetical protein